MFQKLKTGVHPRQTLFLSIGGKYLLPVASGAGSNFPGVCVTEQQVSSEGAMPAAHVLKKMTHTSVISAVRNTNN